MTRLQHLCPLRVAVTLACLAGCWPPGLRAGEAVPKPQRISHAGVAVELLAEPVGGGTRLVEGQEASVRLRITDEAGAGGLAVGRPTFMRADVDAINHPRGYALVVLLWLILSLMIVLAVEMASGGLQPREHLIAIRSHAEKHTTRPGVGQVLLSRQQNLG